MKKAIEIPQSYPESALLRYSPAYFINKVFGYIIAPHHAKILEHYANTQVSLDLAPRGSGKSRIGDIGYSSWVVCNNPNARILILSDTDMHAVRFLSTIKKVLEASPVIKTYYGDIRGEQWSDHQITTALREDKGITEASITALGEYSGGVTTGHYSVIVADDLDNFANTRTVGMRARSKLYWKTTVLPTILPGGEIRCLATRYHFDDLSNMFINEMGYNTQIQPAIINPDTPKEHSIWESFMPLHTRIINGRKVKGLIEIRDGDPGQVADSGIGSLIFNLQYMNNTDLQESGTIFRWEWFNFYDILPKCLKVYQGVDLAISKKDTADFFVLLTIGIDAEGNIYILDIFRERGISFRAQVEAVISKAEEWKPFRIGIENNGYQAALAQEVSRLSLLPVIPLPTTKDKVMRAQMRSGLVEGGRVHVKAGMHDFISELVLFDGTTDMDDQFDAFDLGLTAAESVQTAAVHKDYYQPAFD